MNADLKKILVLKDIRLHREERLRQLKHMQQRRCEHAEQAFQDETRRADQAMAEIQQRKHERWRELVSEAFSSRQIVSAYDQEHDDAQTVLRMEAGLRELKQAMADCRVELAQASINYARGVRKLEASKELLAWHGRIESRRNMLREELLADELQGARHGR